MAPAPRLASLGMYDFPDLRSATDAFWAGLARAFRNEGLDGVPDRLLRGAEADGLCERPALLFCQTCGYPLTHTLAGKVQPVATPVYDAAGCEGPTYRSVFVIRRDDPATGMADLRDRGAAINYRGSQSGWNVLRHAVAGLAEGRDFFGAVLESGSHLGSMQMVSDGQVDIAAIDCVSFALLGDADSPLRDSLRVLATSPAVPSLPYVTAAATSPEDLTRLRAGLQAALADPTLAEARAALRLSGAEPLEVEAYAPILAMEQEAIDRGYPEVR